MPLDDLTEIHAERLPRPVDVLPELCEPLMTTVHGLEIGKYASRSQLHIWIRARQPARQIIAIPGVNHCDDELLVLRHFLLVGRGLR
jgi:hypothetical protein